MEDNGSSKQKGAPDLTIDSLDCKIIQYQYGIRKLTLFIASLKRLVERKDADVTLPMVQYMILMGGSVFAINEAFTQSRLEALGTFKAIKAANFSISSAAMHIPYDISDRPVIPLSEIPDIATGNRCLRLLITLCYSCLQGYQKRLQQCRIEKEKTGPSEALFAEVERYMSSVIVLDDDLDINMDEDFLLQITEDSSVLKNSDYVDTLLADMDIRVLPALVLKSKKILSRLRVVISKFRNLRNIAKVNQEKYLMQQPNWQFTLHRLFAIVLRLNDMYTIIRKTGRKIYLSNVQHLKDPVFLWHFQNSTFFKANVLNNIEELFNRPKRNGMFVATITRFIRQNASHEVNVRSVLDFVNYISQGHMMLEMTITKLQEFVYQWIPTEIKFREYHTLPKTLLVSLNEIMNEEKEKEKAAIAARSVVQTSPKATNVGTPKPIIRRPLDNKDQLKSLSNNLKNLELNNQVGGTKVSRRSSISSVTSSESGSTLLDNESASRKQTSNQPRTTTNRSTTGSRPNSAIFLNFNSSLSDLSSASSEQSERTKGRQRSSSNPLDRSSIHGEYGIATSGAAAALAIRNSTLQPTDSPLRKSLSANFNSNPKPQNVQYRHSINFDNDEKEQIKQTKALTANQRLYKHLKSASKSGQLVTQTKEPMTTVVYDPNNSDSVNFKKQMNLPVSATTSEASKPNSGTNKSQVASRSQVTKLNTQRNSMMSSPQNSENSEATVVSPGSISSGSLSKNDDCVSTKKVRFTGVPDYTEAEDAPTTYSNKILRNFAVFKSPIVVPNVAFKKRDQLLKREESLSLKTKALK